MIGFRAVWWGRDPINRGLTGVNWGSEQPLAVLGAALFCSVQGDRQTLVKDMGD